MYSKILSFLDRDYRDSSPKGPSSMITRKEGQDQHHQEGCQNKAVGEEVWTAGLHDRSARAFMPKQKLFDQYWRLSRRSHNCWQSRSLSFPLLHQAQLQRVHQHDWSQHPVIQFQRVSAKGNENSDRLHCVDSVNSVAILVALSNLEFCDFNQFSRGKRFKREGVACFKNQTTRINFIIVKAPSHFSALRGVF